MLNPFFCDRKLASGLRFNSTVTPDAISENREARLQLKQPSSKQSGRKMPQILQASQLNLYEVHEKFELQEVRDPGFFPEWQGQAHELTEYEQHWLDRAKEDFLDLSQYPVHEEMVKLVVLAPLLSLSGMYRAPFRPVAEHQVELAVDVGDEMVRGRVDLLVLHQQLWVAAIESKRRRLDVSEGFAQTLLYMMASPNTGKPTFGLVANGIHFIFLKLVKGPQNRYAFSDDFSLRRQGNDLYRVLGSLRQLGSIAAQLNAA